MSKPRKKTVANNAASTKKVGGVTGKGFQPGKSGNPSGRPKGAAELGKMLRDFFVEPDPKRRDKTRIRVLVEDMIISDPKTLLAYAFGKPVETHELTNPDGSAIPALCIRVTAAELPKAKDGK